MEHNNQLRIMQAYLVLFHEAAKNAFAWLSGVPGHDFGFAPDWYIEKKLGYIPINTYEAIVEKCFADELQEASLIAEDKREVYLLFCKFFKQKSLPSTKEHNHENYG